MSITFSSNVTDSQTSIKESPCLCAQGAECFCESFEVTEDGGSIDPFRAELAAEAWEKCHTCKGTGVESVMEDDRPFLNMAEMNAQAVLGVLGFTTECWGAVSIPDARRAIMRARARKSLSSFERSEEIVLGERRTVNGVTELQRPVRVHSFGLDSEGIQDRIERFATFVEESAGRGATEISWG